MATAWGEVGSSPNRYSHSVECFLSVTKRLKTASTRGALCRPSSKPYLFVILSVSEGPLVCLHHR